MAEKSFPLNNTLYDASDMRLFLATRTSGVYAAGHLVVTADGSMTINVSKGIAWLQVDEFGGIAYANTNSLPLTVETPDQFMPRIDRVVIRYSIATNKVEAMILKGTPAGNPAPPSLQHTPGGDVYEISLAKVLVEAGAISITAAKLTDETLDPSVCGLMSDGVTSLHTELLTQELARVQETREGMADQLVSWQTEQKDAFDQWFAGVQGSLGDDPAASLANQLQAIRGEKYGGAPKVLTVTGDSWVLIDEENDTYEATIIDASIPADTNDACVLVTYSPESRDLFLGYGVYGYSHTDGQLVLRATGIPEEERPEIPVLVMNFVKGVHI